MRSLTRIPGGSGSAKSVSVFFCPCILHVSRTNTNSLCILAGDVHKWSFVMLHELTAAKVCVASSQMACYAQLAELRKTVTHPYRYRGRSCNPVATSKPSHTASAKRSRQQAGLTDNSKTAHTVISPPDPNNTRAHVAKCKKTLFPRSNKISMLKLVVRKSELPPNPLFLGSGKQLGLG